MRVSREISVDRLLEPRARRRVERFAGTELRQLLLQLGDLDDLDSRCIDVARCSPAHDRRARSHNRGSDVVIEARRGRRGGRVSAQGRLDVACTTALVVREPVLDVRAVLRGPPGPGELLVGGLSDGGAQRTEKRPLVRIVQQPR